MKPLRFAMLGCGYWSQFQLAAWTELEGAVPVALYNRTLSKAEALGKRFGVARTYDDVEKLLDAEELDFVDIVTNVETHAEIVEAAARRGLPVICQKPMAPDLPTAERMVQTCLDAGVELWIHENWRWQHPIREFHRALASPELGRVFRARITYSNSFPVFENQPFLARLEQFILMDMGSHILDVARFLFGEPECVYCRTTRVTPGIRGEDVATVVLGLGDGATVTCEISYASRVEHDRFPETFIHAECEHGSVELGPDFSLRVTTAEGTMCRRCPPRRYDWADPAYGVVHASIVACNENLLAGLRGALAETTDADNLRTVRLVHTAYRSAAQNACLPVAE
jgi:D-apiose dehydrogenase